jgi:hypothetical protein
MQAEQRVYNSVKFPALRKNVTGTISAGVKYITAPDDFLSVFSIAVIDTSGNYNYLLNKDVNFIRSSFPNPNDVGLPQYYALFGPSTTNSTTPVITNAVTFIMGPTPNISYSTEMHYYYYPASIVVSGNTWLGNNFDSILFYGTLLEAYTYMKGEPDVLAQYQRRYDEALILAKNLGDVLNRNDSYRNPPPVMSRI